MPYKQLTTLVMLLLLSAACSKNALLVEHEAPDGTNKPGAGSAAEENLTPDGHNSRNALDWAGTYSGVLPCADCPGIETSVTLHSDGSYERSMRYLDETPGLYRDEGTFAWDAAGGRIELSAEDDEIVKYQVGENQLFHLDRDGQRITSELAAHYVLQKHQQDIALERKRWQLVELRGNPVEPGNNAVLSFDGEGFIASGNLSCNTFTAGYVIKNFQRISFRQIASTKMACPDMRTESALVDVLQNVDNYALSDDGQLSLNRARMAPLARFEVLEE